VLPKHNADRARARRLWKRYGITLKQYDRMLKRQGGKCAICRNPPKTMRLATDHDHTTKRVRGLLCMRCNYRLLGRGLESPFLHRQAAKYLTSRFDGRKI
jgi:hypothetical protein